LKSNRPETIVYIKKIKSEYKKILKNPLKYFILEREQNVQKNNELRFEILQAMKPQKMKKYKAFPVKTIFIPKVTGTLKLLGISTIKDRAIQTLFKLAMEAYLEPLGDPNSFGFRPGRGCQHAVAEVANRFIFNKSSGSKTQKARSFRRELLVIKKKSLKRSYVPQTIVEGDIKKCFDNISHEWLIDNVPMPENYEHFLLEFFKAKKTDPIDGLIDIGKGVPQGGIISPLFLNWVLDGMEDLVKEFTGKRYKNREQIKYLKPKILIKKTYPHFFSKSSAWFVRYVDDFIIGLRPQSGVHLFLIEKLKEFLGKRGLELSAEKTLIRKQKIGHKFDFLGWRFHFINPNKVNWMISAPKGSGGELSDRKGVYTYPSPKSTKYFRKAVKSITNSSKVNSSIYTIILNLSALIKSWDNYFTGGKTRVLKRKLDWYVAKRCRMFLFKKYKGKYGEKIQTFLKKDGKWSPLSVLLENA
jgi:RNA-directed DNA polymerase